MVPTQGDRPNQGVAPPQGGQPNQGVAPPQGGQPNQGVAPPQGGQPNQGVAPPQGGRPNQGTVPPQGGRPNQGVPPPQGGRPNQGAAPLQAGPPNQGVAPPQGGQPDQGMAASVGGQPEEMSEEHKKLIQKEMFQLAMDNRWNEVETKYKNNRFAQEAIITSSEDTILHIAVINNKQSTVETLVEAVTDMSILQKVNNRGNTALHLAAAMGNVGMCICMADKHPPLVAKRNNEGETPLFLAALHGKKDAFLYLHSKCPQTHGSEYWRRKEDGNSILHAAIVGEYFDLAYQIIKKYKKDENPALDLVNFVNERGQSALHLLASNPSAFESGSHLGRLERLIYHCILVNQLEETMDSDSTIDEEYQREDILPKNYATCMQFYLLLRRLFRFSLGGPRQLWLWWWRRPPCQRDEENQRNVKSGPTGGDGSTSRNNQSGGSRNNHEHPLPPNYITCYDFFELALMLLQVFGLGLISTNKIKEKKRKHTWAAQIMGELVSRASSWEYNAGNKPPPDSGIRSLIAASSDEMGPILHQENDLHEKNDKTKEGGEMMGVILQKILNIYPTWDDELRLYGKNTVLMKMENTQPHMYMLTMEMMKKNKDEGGKETPILVAAKKGVKEMVEKIIEKFPVAIQDVSEDGKKIVLLAVENRQPHVYKFLLDKYKWNESLFQQLDHEGNSALHLAAMLGQNRPWIIPGAALQMQWEIKWYKFVKESMPRHFFTRLNNKGQTSKEVFTETHKELVRDGGAWLTNTSQSCSVVAALIATVAFATATAVPGGINESTGTPTLVGKPAFEVFAITSLIALCSSVTSLTMFLAILTSRYQEADFRRSLPRKLILGLTSLFVSIASILVSFCAGHFFVLKEKLKYAAFPVYGITCLPVTLFAVAQFPLYLDLIRSFLTSVPRRTYEVTSL